MARNFNELRSKMSPRRRARNQARAQAMLTEMALAEIRRAAGLSQTKLADQLGVSQANLSKLERAQDIKVGTLQRWVGALGGRLDFVVTMPSGGQVRINQFGEDAQTAS